MLLKRKRRVLLLDDDPSMQRLVSSLLQREGFRVDVFLTGRDALRALDRGKYDVLLLDLMMPHEGGMTVIRHLRKNDPEPLHRALLLTAMPKSTVDSLQKEVAGIVQKPFDPPQLIGAVREITDKK